MQRERQNRAKFSKLLTLMLVLAMGLGVGLVGCKDKKEDDKEEQSSGGETEAFSGTINVVTREDGSGTRGAFVELFEVQELNADGKKIDAITGDAITTSSTSVMLTTVAGDERAIGYVSLGSLNDTVRAVSIDGVEATTANAASGAYPITRPFHIVTCGDVSDEAQDFINFIMSKEGQAIIVARDCIAIDDNAPAFTSNGASGKIVVGGSSSVGPVMEKLIEAYAEINPDLEVELQISDSGTGVSSTLSGAYTIGMASRDLKDSELADGCVQTQIATDGIAVIVSTDNPIDNLTNEQVRDIFLGVITDWEEL